MEAIVPAQVRAPVSNVYVMRELITAFELSVPVRLVWRRVQREPVIKISTVVDKARPVVNIHWTSCLNELKVWSFNMYAVVADADTSRRIARAAIGIVRRKFRLLSMNIRCAKNIWTESVSIAGIKTLNAKYGEMLLISLGLP